jgi:hypothetical protein
MPQADLLVIDRRPEEIFLFRHTLTGESGGDTWRRSVEEAKSQADWEYGEAIEWLSIPDDEPDVAAYALSAAKNEADL